MYLFYLYWKSPCHSIQSKNNGSELLQQVAIFAAALAAVCAQHDSHGHGHATSSQSFVRHEVRHEQQHGQEYHHTPIVHHAPVVHHVAPVVHHVAPAVHHAAPVHHAPSHHEEEHYYVSGNTVLFLKLYTILRCFEPIQKNGIDYIRLFNQDALRWFTQWRVLIDACRH